MASRFCLWVYLASHPVSWDRLQLVRDSNEDKWCRKWTEILHSLILTLLICVCVVTVQVRLPTLTGCLFVTSVHFSLPSTRAVHQTTVDPDELKYFRSLAIKWWDENGVFRALHAMNDLRVPFIRDNLNVHKAHHPGKPLAGLRVLDVGCGGGLLTEPLGRLGANVLGIDPVEESIGTAQLHLSYDPDLSERVSYRACTLEELSANVAEREVGRGDVLFDAIVASEVVEHLAELETFAFCCGRVLKPGGSLFITTINKTNLSYVLAIVVAEQLLRIVPRGTHDWEKFISPIELERLLESNGFSVKSVQGLMYNPASGAWSWINSNAINYALHAVKLAEEPQSDPQTGSLT